MQLITLCGRLVGDDSGQDLAEYAVALTLIVFGAGLAAITIATNMGKIWDVANSLIASAA